MTRSDMVIRSEQSGDHAEIAGLLKAAFDGAVEADLVERLRSDKDIVQAFVAVSKDGTIAGYAAFLRLWLTDGEQTRPVVGVAPLAVSPADQKRGIGGALMATGLEWLKQQGELLVFVLGDPAYYVRFGFDLSVAEPFISEYAGPYFMALALQPDAPAEGRLIYPRAFADQG
jgi:putative acetyltransferase